MSLQNKKPNFTWHSQILIVLATIAAMILFTACGQFTITNTAQLTTATVTPVLIATNTAIHPLKTGVVTLQTDRTSYQSKDTISAILKNQSNQTIYFPDHLTNCSVVLLLHLTVQPLTSDDGTVPINLCKTKTASRIESLAAGQTLVVKLLAPSTDWLPGLYRATLTYNTSFKQPKTIYTAAITVGPFTPQPSRF